MTQIQCVVQSLARDRHVIRGFRGPHAADGHDSDLPGLEFVPGDGTIAFAWL